MKSGIYRGETEDKKNGEKNGLEARRRLVTFSPVPVAEETLAGLAASLRGTLDYIFAAHVDG